MAGDEVLEALRAGDEGAFADVFRDVQPRLLRYLSTMVGVDDAEEVAGEAWAQAFRDLPKFKGTLDGFRGWVTTIARNRAMDLLRSQARRPFADIDPDDHADTVPSAEADALDSIGTGEALALIGSLPPEQAEAVLLRVVMKLDAKSAARVLGKRPGAVRTAAYRGLKSLGERLSDTFDGSDAEGTK